MSSERILLPEPEVSGLMSVETALMRRRSIREYSDEPLSLREISQILWSAQGVKEGGRRTSPSAGATYPFEIFAAVREVEELAAGIYHYDPFEHAIRMVRRGDFSKELQRACLNQRWVGEASANLVLVAHYERTTRYYGERGIRYVHMEAGHIGQNIYLQATAMNLGTVAIGAFHDHEVAEIIGTKGSPLYVFPLGRLR
ncbi:MAG: hypothetical protein PWR13_419 [Archaeoglobi archaeon]|nr:hypothetical protein [Archaeoglobi archaeon]